ncbi:hypothetical protein, partial [Streptomyces heilongjiangensis]
MIFQLLDGAPVGIVAAVSVICAALALARLAKSLPKDTISKLFEHRTTKYQIIANDAKGRLAAMQKQRLVFFAFVVTCIAVIMCALITSKTNEAAAPADSPVPKATT